MKTKLITIFLTIISCVACKNNVDENYTKYFQYSVTLDSTNNWDYRRYMDAIIKVNNQNTINKYYLYDIKLNKLYTYTQSGKVNNSYIINDKIYGRIENFCFKSDDSIYTITDDGIICLSNTDKTNIVYFPDSVTNNKFKNTWICSTNYFSNFNINNNKVGLITSPQISVKEYNKIYSNYLYATFNLINNKLVYNQSYCKLPDRYTKNYYPFGLPTIYSDTNKIVYIIDDQDVMYVEYFNDSSKNKTIQIGGKEFIENKPYPVKEIGNGTFELKYLIENSSNSFFSYDVINHFFVRIYTTPINFVGDNNLVHNIHDNPFIIDIIDTNYNLVKEVKFLGSKYDLARTLISANGIMLRKLNEKKISYDVYKIK